MQTVLNELAILEQVWDRSLDVALIAVPLAQCAADEPAQNVQQLMREKNWDVVGVHRAGDADAVAYAYVERERLAGLTCGENAKAFVIDELVALHTPIRSCMGKLIQRRRLFVLGRDGVEMIATLADLNKPPVRLMLFAAVSMLETAISAAVRDAFPDDAWAPHISPSRLEYANTLQNDRKKRQQDLDLLDCLQLGDKTDLLLKVQDSPAWLGFTSKNTAKAFFEDLERLRNSLAHSLSPVNGSTWEQVHSTYRKADEITHRLARAWRESST